MRLKTTAVTAPSRLSRPGGAQRPGGARTGAHERFDVLVSDIGLPDESGVDLMQAQKAKHPIFGIALTGFGMKEDLRRSHDVGFHHHLIKPVDLNKLDALIQQADPCPEELAAQT